MEARTGRRYRRGESLAVQGLQGGQGRHWEHTGDSRRPRSLLGHLTVLEGRERQRKKEGGTNADEEGDDCTQRKVPGPGEHDGELIAGAQQ
jgi:hypothetical protein